jgi:hypothetical protein
MYAFSGELRKFFVRKSYPQGRGSERSFSFLESFVM